MTGWLVSVPRKVAAWYLKSEHHYICIKGTLLLEIQPYLTTVGHISYVDPLTVMLHGPLVLYLTNRWCEVKPFIVFHKCIGFYSNFRAFIKTACPSCFLTNVTEHFVHLFTSEPFEFFSPFWFKTCFCCFGGHLIFCFLTLLCGGAGLSSVICCSS